MLRPWRVILCKKTYMSSVGDEYGVCMSIYNEQNLVVSIEMCQCLKYGQTKYLHAHRAAHVAPHQVLPKQKSTPKAERRLGNPETKWVIIVDKFFIF